MPTELSLVMVLEHYGVNLASVPSAGWHMINCPFHSDQRASAGVNVDAGKFHCHACGVAGDAIDIIKTVEHLDYGGAVEFAREVLGASIETVPRPVSRSRKRRPLGSEKWKAVLE